MKSTELRIGNIVSYGFDYGDNLLCKVCSINKKGVLIDLDKRKLDVIIERIVPIPLTEEWLLKLGFKNEHNPIYFSIDGFYIEYKNDEFTTEVGECSYLVLEYVHQLQNLYFALTGEELVINELP